MAILKIDTKDSLDALGMIGKVDAFSALFCPSGVDVKRSLRHGHEPAR